MISVQKRSIKIADNGEVHTLHYDNLLEYHQGDSIWGLSVAFRALQLAAELFSEKYIWDRNNLFIISSHPGPGVRDAVEFITHCISRNKFQLADKIDRDMQCSSNMEYKWEIRCDTHAKEIVLKDDFVPIEFHELLDRLNTKKEKSKDKEKFKDFKNSLVEKIWSEPIASSYLVNNNLAKPMSKECIN